MIKNDIIVNDNLYLLYNVICNLYLCPPEYVEKVYNIVRQNLIMSILSNSILL